MILRTASMQRNLCLQPTAAQEAAEAQVHLPPTWARDFEVCPQQPLLGKGTFGQIVKVIQRSTGLPFAVKVCERSFFSARGMDSHLASEVETLRRATKRRCRHVVRLQDLFADCAHVFLRMELCGGGNLQQVALKRPGSRIPENEVAPLILQLCTGLQDLHAIGILHRDIKPENLLLTLDGCLKIADFGWATLASSATSSLAGTFHYMAPEVLLGWQVHTEAVDVWSSGAALFEILTGHVVITKPTETGFSAIDECRGIQVRKERLLLEIAAKCPLPQERRFSFLSNHCWVLLTMMLMPETDRRISVHDVLNQQWLHSALMQRSPVVFPGWGWQQQQQQPQQPPQCPGPGGSLTVPSLVSLGGWDRRPRVSCSVGTKSLPNDSTLRALNRAATLSPQRMRPRPTALHRGG